MRLATLKKDFYFRRGGPRISGGVLPKGATIQVVKYDLVPQQLYGYRLLAPGGLYSLVREDELDDTVEFLDDETSDT